MKTPTLGNPQNTIRFCKNIILIFRKNWTELSDR